MGISSVKVRVEWVESEYSKNLHIKGIVHLKNYKCLVTWSFLKKANKTAHLVSVPAKEESRNCGAALYLHCSSSPPFHGLALFFSLSVCFLRVVSQVLFHLLKHSHLSRETDRIPKGSSIFLPMCFGGHFFLPHLSGRICILSHGYVTCILNAEWGCQIEILLLKLSERFMNCL